VDDDPELSRGFAARESWAYDAAYRLYGPVLYAAAFGVLRGREEAQDCVHDVLLRLWRQRGAGYRVGRGSLRAFIAVCVRNEALTRLRKAHNRDRIANTMPEERTPEPDIGEGVVQRDAVARAMVVLSDAQRRSVRLAYFDHLTHEQIARELDEPVGTIKSRLSTSLRRLRDAFASSEDANHAAT
jgi:RNA polymerase sigma-70 factor (ECF subfamily)